ncbi:glucose-1-phosphate thymidylyltransferase [Proteiniborus sp.]|uniref:glucose-1-phosphate thymidylyltransferase n=1 Tax=Proteiniborus sp. TaxID=2079015 RepID=UPI003332B73F
MKGVILCGGLGTRLRPITYSIPKQLIPISNRPIIYYILDSLVKAKVNEIGIVINDNEDFFKEVLKGYEDKEIKFKFIQQSQPLGLADAVSVSEDFVKDEDFIVVIGDNYYELDLENLISDFYDTSSNCSILLHEVDEPYNYGIAEVKEGQILDVEEKPRNPKTNLAITGIYIFDKNIFKACKEIGPSWRGEYEITDGIKWLLNNSYKVTYNISNSLWMDLGTYNELLHVNQHLLSKVNPNNKGLIDEKSKIVGSISIGDNSKIFNSIIRGPAIIGSNTIIENSYIGPYTSIMNNVKIIDSQIENSIVLDKCSILKISNIIDSSIIERNSTIVSNNSYRKANTFILGKDSNLILY